MIISSSRATVGLVATATPSSSRTSGAVQIGNNNIAVPIDTPDSTYVVRAIYSAAAETMTINLLTGVTSAATAFVAGVAQVETATAAGTVTVAGNASIVVTSAGMTGSPLTIPVAVAVSDTPTLWATKVRTALNANASVSVRFTIGGTGAAIMLTRKPVRTFALPVGTLNHFAANDATANLSLATGTATGITAAPTSADTTAGVLTTGVKIYDDATDFEGVPIVSVSPKAILLSLSDRGQEAGSSDATIVTTGTDKYKVTRNGNVAFIGNGQVALSSDSILTITAASGHMDLSITVAR